MRGKTSQKNVEWVWFFPSLIEDEGRYNIAGKYTICCAFFSPSAKSILYWAMQNLCIHFQQNFKVVVAHQKKLPSYCVMYIIWDYESPRKSISLGPAPVIGWWHHCYSCDICQAVMNYEAMPVAPTNVETNVLWKGFPISEVISLPPKTSRGNKCLVYNSLFGMNSRHHFDFANKLSAQCLSNFLTSRPPLSWKDH